VAELEVACTEAEATEEWTNVYLSDPAGRIQDATVVDKINRLILVDIRLSESGIGSMPKPRFQIRGKFQFDLAYESPVTGFNVNPMPLSIGLTECSSEIRLHPRCCCEENYF